jgi:hypothetical protein
VFLDCVRGSGQDSPPNLASRRPPGSRDVRGSGGAKPPKMGFCSGGTRGAKKCEKRAFLGQKRAKNDDF